MTDPTLVAAFAAGVVSFVSPCVLPIVPGYLSYMSGLSVSTEGDERRIQPWVAACAFVLGFSLIFVALGASVTLLGSFLRDNQEALARIGGLLIIVFGLIFMGALKIPALYQEKRFHPTPGAGLWGSVILGAAFAFGWSPCIGTTLAAVLLMAAGRSGSGGAAEGALLLLSYSLGLGLPFIAAGLGISKLAGAMSWLRKHTRTVNLVSGILLVAVGLLLVTGQFFQLSIWFQRTFPATF